MAVRLFYTEAGATGPLKVTTWDALGYYMYLPAKHIYHDEQDLKWFAAIDSTYSLSGGELYQAFKQPDGRYVFKYLKGVSQLQLPFFAVAHWVALHSTYPADGFSLPYQIAVAVACLFYCILALFVLRHILLRYFNDHTTALTLLLLGIATNFIQYVSVDSAQSHGFIFPLYAFMLYTTIQWYQKPRLIWALLVGALIGLATTCRPTEAVMLFIPLLWKRFTAETFQEKWSFIKQHFVHVIFVVSGLLLAVLPQLFYWKRVTGSWVYDVGSKWDFLNPHFRVLVGWEKGWFIYTPVTVLMVAGFFLMKKSVYRTAVITFCLLNIYIIISWHIWRYGASYSCRALMQSYPIFAFPLACFVSISLRSKWKYIAYILFIYLGALNIFQIWQYNQNILHYDDMNFKYYKAIFLDPDPDALDMSLLDTYEMPGRLLSDTGQLVCSNAQSRIVMYGDTLLQCQFQPALNRGQEVWLKVEARIFAEKELWNSYLKCTLEQDTVKEVKIRMFHALADTGRLNEYAFFIKIPQTVPSCNINLKLDGNEQFKGTLQQVQMTAFYK